MKQLSSHNVHHAEQNSDHLERETNEMIPMAARAFCLEALPRKEKVIQSRTLQSADIRK